MKLPINGDLTSREAMASIAAATEAAERSAAVLNQEREALRTMLSRLEGAERERGAEQQQQREK